MDGASLIKRDIGTKSNDRGRSGDQISEHVRRLVQSDRFNRISEQLYDDLRRRLALYVSLPQEFLQLSAGINHAIDRLVRTFCRPGDEALICGPVETDAPMLLEKSGMASLYHYGVSPFSVDIDGIIEKISDRTGLIYIEQPGTITGTVFSRYEIESILNAARRAILVINEAQFELFGSTMADLVRDYPNLIIIRQFYDPRQVDETPLCYMLAGRKTTAVISKFISEPHLSSLKMRTAAALMGDLPKIRERAEKIHEAMLYLSVRLRSIGVLCRLTPGDSVLIRALDTERVVAALNNAGIEARTLRHLHQLKNYLTVVIEDETTVRRLVETIEKIPRQFISGGPLERARLTLRRHPETAAARNTKKTEIETVKDSRR